MSYNAWPACADVVGIEFVQEQAPKAWAELNVFVGKHKITIDDIAVYIDRDYDIDSLESEEHDTLMALWEAIQKEFQDNTDMELSMGYFEPEASSRANEIDNGAYFYVSNYEVFKPKAEQFKDKVQHKQWITFG